MPTEPREPGQAQSETEGADRSSGTVPDPASRRTCRDCGGEMAEGQFILPLLGKPKFGIRLAMMTIESDTAAAMCLACGHIEIWVENLDRIRRAQDADQRVRERTRRLHGA